MSIILLYRRKFPHEKQQKEQREENSAKLTDQAACPEFHELSKHNLGDSLSLHGALLQRAPGISRCHYHAARENKYITSKFIRAVPPGSMRLCDPAMSIVPGISSSSYLLLWLFTMLTWSTSSPRRRKVNESEKERSGLSRMTQVRNYGLVSSFVAAPFEEKENFDVRGGFGYHSSLSSSSSDTWQSRSVLLWLSAL